MTEPLRVFIVDDEPPARERLAELLEDCRAEVPNVSAGEAANGVEALARLPATAPDVVLVDVHMPGMNGIEFARHLQKLEHPPAVIFVTAFDQYAVQAFEVNALDYLLKPVRRPGVSFRSPSAGGFGSCRSPRSSTSAPNSST